MSRTNLILIVDDSDNDVLLARRSFAKAGFGDTLRVARDGECAVAYLRGDGEFADRARHPLPALVLLDLKLPRRTGFEVLEWIRSTPTLRRLPVAILTSSADPRDIARAYDGGVNAYLVKPVSSDAMRAMAEAVGQFWLGHNQPPPLCVA